MTEVAGTTGFYTPVKPNNETLPKDWLTKAAEVVNEVFIS